MAIYHTRISGRRDVADNTIELSLRKPAGFTFKAGQYIQLAVPQLLYADPRGTYRLFSIASSPLDANVLTVAFRMSGSGFKRTISELPIGSPVDIEGPHGFFTVPETTNSPQVFIAGGIGITPYASMARYCARNGFSFEGRLIYGARSKGSAPFLTEITDIARRNKDFSVQPVFGIVDEHCIRSNIMPAHVAEYSWHIAGPPAMVWSVRNILSLMGIDYGRIYAEEFTGYA